MGFDKERESGLVIIDGVITLWSLTFTRSFLLEDDTTWGHYIPGSVTPGPRSISTHVDP
jgi:hypothetical protein